MRTFLMLYTGNFDDDDDRHPYKSVKSLSSERRAFTLLASVCWSWHQTLTGWPESPTCHWVRHQLKKLIERKYYVTSVFTYSVYVDMFRSINQSRIFYVA